MMRPLFQKLLASQQGTAAIEATICLPFLLTMALGSFDIGMLVSHQQQLQSGANEAQAIILAAAAGEGVDSATIQDVLHDSLELPLENITLEAVYRCGTAEELTSAPCTTDTPYQFVRLTLTDSYTPMWTHFGVGNTVEYNVTRTVQVG
ncbi:MAG: TadE/TadG family type IV pilus assembly protein [Croceibacterium sp.]